MAKRLSQQEDVVDEDEFDVPEETDSRIDESQSTIQSSTPEDSTPDSLNQDT